MKLKNLLFATMFACAFASCSNEDDPINNKPTGEGNATLDIKIAAPTTTKATGETAGKTDQTISSLNVYVFNGTDQNAKFEKSGSLKDSEINVGEVLGLTAGQKQVIVLANAAFGSLTNTTTLSEALAQTKDFANEVDGTLSMNSKVYDVNIQAGVMNYLGFDNPTGGHIALDLQNKPVYLYRNVAKVVLSSLTLNTTGSIGSYPSAQFIVDSVYILHGNKYTRLASASAWGPTGVQLSGSNYINGVVMSQYENWRAITQSISNFTWMQGILSSSSDYDTNAIPNYLKTLSEATIASSGSSISLVDSFYVYEDKVQEVVPQNAMPSVGTLLVVAGRFIYGDINASSAKVRYYSVAIGKDGYTPNNLTLQGATRMISGVVRNVQYNIDLTVKGPGWATPFGGVASDNTVLDVKVQVVPFGTVTQNPSIE